MLIYVGKKEEIGNCSIFVIIPQDESHERAEMIPLRHVVYHSPDGLQWGYGGSGPADTALSILYDYFLRQGKNPQQARKIADNLHQDFKWRFIAPITPVAIDEEGEEAGGNLCIFCKDIEKWLQTENLKSY